MIICKGCKATFPCDEFGESPDFDGHKCPKTPKCLPGESWEDYKKRCDEFEAANA